MFTPEFTNSTLDLGAVVHGDEVSCRPNDGAPASIAGNKSFDPAPRDRE